MENYAKSYNSIRWNKKLSLAARAVLIDALDNIEGWKFISKVSAKQIGLGEKLMQRTLNELVKEGYLKRTIYVDDKNKFKCKYEFFLIPIPENERILPKSRRSKKGGGSNPNVQTVVTQMSRPSPPKCPDGSNPNATHSITLNNTFIATAIATEKKKSCLLKTSMEPSFKKGDGCQKAVVQFVHSPWFNLDHGAVVQFVHSPWFKLNQYNQTNINQPNNQPKAEPAEEEIQLKIENKHLIPIPLTEDLFKITFPQKTATAGQPASLLNNKKTIITEQDKSEGIFY